MVNIIKAIFLSIGLAIILLAIVLILSKPNQLPQSIDSAESNSTRNTSQENSGQFFRRSPGVRTCHPSYSGCLDAFALDYDCEGTFGDGPQFTGLVQVIGPDVFLLDEDENGWGCD